MAGRGFKRKKEEAIRVNVVLNTVPVNLRNLGINLPPAVRTIFRRSHMELYNKMRKGAVVQYARMTISGTGKTKRYMLTLPCEYKRRPMLMGKKEKKPAATVVFLTVPSSVKEADLKGVLSKGITLLHNRGTRYGLVRGALLSSTQLRRLVGEALEEVTGAVTLRAAGLIKPSKAPLPVNVKKRGNRALITVGKGRKPTTVSRLRLLGPHPVDTTKNIAITATIKFYLPMYRSLRTVEALERYSKRAAAAINKAYGTKVNWKEINDALSGKLRKG